MAQAAAGDANGAALDAHYDPVPKEEDEPLDADHGEPPAEPAPEGDTVGAPHDGDVHLAGDDDPEPAPAPGAGAPDDAVAVAANGGGDGGDAPSHAEGGGVTAAEVVSGAEHVEYAEPSGHALPVQYAPMPAAAPAAVMAAAVAAVTSGNAAAAAAAAAAAGGGGGSGASPGGDGRGRRNAERYHASMEQLRHLVASFEDNPCPSVATLTYLSETIGMPMHNLVLWFKNRRARSKKTHRVPGQRRSYVKSGIYSRSRRAPAIQPGPLADAPAPQPPAHAGPAPPPLPPPLPGAAGAAGAALAVPPAPAAAAAAAAAALEDGMPEPLTEQADDAPPILQDAPRFEPLAPAAEDGKRPAPGASPPAKRARVSDEPEEQGAAGVGCRRWSSVQCLQAFVSFFERSTGGLNPEQGKAAAAVAELFFIGEMQSGLTVSSVAQPLSMSLQVLDELLARRAAVGEPPLSSGPRAVLGEFIAQLRSGEAAVFAPPSPVPAVHDAVDSGEKGRANA